MVQRSNGKDNVFKSGCTWNKAKWVKRVYFRLEFRFSLLLICLISFLFSILFALAHHLHEDVFFFASTTIIFLKVFSSVRPFSFTWNPLSQRTFFFYQNHKKEYSYSQKSCFLFYSSSNSLIVISSVGILREDYEKEKKNEERNKNLRGNKNNNVTTINKCNANIC